MATFNNGIILVPAKVTFINTTYTVPAGHVFVGNYMLPASSMLTVDGQIMAQTAAGGSINGTLFAGGGRQ